MDRFKSDVQLTHTFCMQFNCHYFSIWNIYGKYSAYFSLSSSMKVWALMIFPIFDLYFAHAKTHLWTKPAHRINQTNTNESVKHCFFSTIKDCPSCIIMFEAFYELVIIIIFLINLKYFKDIHDLFGLKCSKNETIKSNYQKWQLLTGNCYWKPFKEMNHL